MQSDEEFYTTPARLCEHTLFVNIRNDAPFQLIHLRLFSMSRSRTMNAATFTICARAPGRDEETRDEPQRAARCDESSGAHDEQPHARH